jgi:peptidoglycan/LPS O-acetylase OafA/YrhL
VTSPAPARTTLPVSEPVAAKRDHLEALTGVRILAALAVYLSHVPAPRGAPESLATFLASGYMGVTLFFVLSGFVLALNYFDALERPSGRKLWSYAIARFARVYPLYVVVLAYVLIRLHANGQPIEDWLPHALAIQSWNPDVTFAFGFNGPGWSIGVELFLYACFPLLVLVLARLRSLRSLTVAAVVVAAALLGLTAWFVATGRADLPMTDPGSAHRWLYRTPLPRLLDFMLGILAARLYLELRHRQPWAQLGTVLAIAAGVTIVSLMALPAHFQSAWSLDASYAIPAAIMIFGLAIAPGGLPARSLALPFIVLLGEASYAFYLVHQPLLGILGAGQWATAVTMSSVAYELATLGLVLAVAVGLHVTVETPARIWIRKLAHRPPP